MQNAPTVAISTTPLVVRIIRLKLSLVPGVCVRLTRAIGHHFFVSGCGGMVAGSTTGATLDPIRSTLSLSHSGKYPVSRIRCLSSSNVISGHRQDAASSKLHRHLFAVREVDRRAVV